MDQNSFVTKRFRVSVFVEVTTFDIPKTLEETRARQGTSYGEGMEDYLALENELMNALQANPDVMNRYLEARSVIEVQNNRIEDLLFLATGEDIDPSDLLSELEDNLSPESLEIVSCPEFSYFNCHALDQSFTTEILGVRVDEDELSESSETGEGEGN